MKLKFHPAPEIPEGVRDIYERASDWFGGGAKAFRPRRRSRRDLAGNFANLVAGRVATAPQLRLVNEEEK